MPSNLQTGGHVGTARRKTFTTRLELGGKTATGIEVPPQVIEVFGAGKRPPVKVIIKDHSWESTVAVMGGRFMVGVPAEHRVAAGVTAGDTLTVTLELDDAPRSVAVPRDLVEALAAADATAAFEQLAPSRRKEHVRSVEDARTPETRARRIAKVIDALS